MNAGSRTAVIVQARLESTRFHGKVLEKIDDETVLHHVLTRCLNIPSADVVCCAIPDTPENDVVARRAEEVGATVYRGSVDDLLDRYYQAAKFLKADSIMRVTSDCPLIDPDICDAVIALHAETGVDYACNNMPVVWPHGLDCEIFTFPLLEKAAQQETRAWVREHVTEWMREDDSVTRASLPGPGGGVEDLRWTVDYKEDLEFVRAVFAAADRGTDILRCQDVLEILRAHPELVDINRPHTSDNRNPDTLPAHDIERFASILPKG
jgi:spore coat polysaccharide biosynthesis protein SpsF